MRLIDFIVYYNMANFKRKKRTESELESQLRAGVFFASLPVSLFFYTLMLIIFFLVFHVNIIEGSYLRVLPAIWMMVNYLLLSNIYIKKNRYAYISSPEYKPFTFSITWGVSICFLTYFISLIVFVGTAAYVHSLLPN
jgi:hypothetical protein